jgi:hypothetical protein
MFVLLSMSLSLLLSCVSVDSDAPPSDESVLILPDGKQDTGYYSNLAMELEGDFVSTITLEVTHLSEAERDKLLDQTVLGLIAEKQVKMAKGQLNEKQLHLNLTAGDVNFIEKGIITRADGDFLMAQYSVVAESLVTLKELKEEGISPQDLENTTHQVIVPEDPRDLFLRAGESCAEGFVPGDLKESNYFYYFKPEKPTCKLEMSANTTFTLRSLLPQRETFPEYDRLVEDGILETAVVFGAYTDDEPPQSDWGVMMHRSYAVHLKLSGWDRIEGLSVGQRYQRQRGDLIQEIDLFSPTDLYHLQDTNAAFAELLKTKEVIVYNGHSFYGSLEALDRASNYPESRYQILFMNSCWSYEYYTKQVFVHKATEEDPSGWADVDVINNTTYAYFPQMGASTNKFITNLLAGAVHLGADDQGRRYSWQNIIGIMNDEASGVCPEDADPRDCRRYRPKNAHEVYGVSGVRDNRFTPSR